MRGGGRDGDLARPVRAVTWMALCSVIRFGPLCETGNSKAEGPEGCPWWDDIGYLGFQDLYSWW